jgi:hypothetical protein
MLHPETTVSENLETQQLPLQQFNNNEFKTAYPKVLTFK